MQLKLSLLQGAMTSIHETKPNQRQVSLHPRVFCKVARVDDGPSLIFYKAVHQTSVFPTTVTQHTSVPEDNARYALKKKLSRFTSLVHC